MATLNFDIVDPAELTGYVRELPFGDIVLDGILPNELVDDLEYRILRGATNDVDAAKYRALDAEAPIGKRQGVTRISGAIPPISKKLLLGEESTLRLRALQNGGNMKPLADQIYADAKNLARAVAVRIELARAEVIRTGKLVLNENGVQATIDYSRAAGHTVTAGTLWTNTGAAVPITDILAWKSTYNSTNGVDPGAMVVSDTVITNLLLNAQVRAAVANVVNVTPNLVTRDQLKAVFLAFGLPPMIELNHRFRIDGVNTRAIPANEVIFLPPAGEPLGATVYGVTAEAIKLAELGKVKLSEAPGIVAVVEETFDPVGTWTKAAGLAVPVLANPDLTFKATVG